MRTPRIIKEVNTHMYDNKFDDDKGSKEKEEQKSSSKDSKENKQNFSPSLTSPKEDKTRNFAPKLTEADKKDGPFKPSLSNSKDTKNDAFKPKLNPEPKNSEKSFSPSLEMPEKQEKCFTPSLKQNQNTINKGGGKKLTIQDMQKIAQDRGGKCLSQKYTNNKSNLKWQCSNGHEWSATPDNVKNKGTWCAKCAGNYKYTIKDMQELAKSRGGECLSTEYTNANTSLDWKCKNGHEWNAVPNSVISQGSWCPECAPNTKQTINDMQKIAKERGGECLSKEYQGAKENHIWKCSQGHKWEATPDNVKNQNSWCPKCSDGTAERTCRQFFEKLFDKKFDKSYPSWLRSPAGNQMHLDGYNEDLNLAFERQGPQHYQFTPYFHKNMKEFETQQENDTSKLNSCKDYGAKLIEVPYTVKIENIEEYIRDQVKNLGIKAPMNPDKIDYKTFKFNTKNKLEEMQKLAKSRGGKLLSKKYINAHSKLEWQCKEGHIWPATPNNIKNNAKGKDGIKGNWCPKCAQKQKYTMNDIKNFAQTKGGECLSSTYERAHGILKWRCKNNHEFKASFYSVNIKDTWCNECKKDDLFQNFKNIAEARGGKCLSEKYNGTHSKLDWRCDKGHEWPATPNSIKGGSWCPECVGHHKYTIEHMKDLAKSYGGECLSDKYLGAKTHLKWRCSNGHKWTASPNHVKNNKKWCNECDKEKKAINT